MKTSFRTIITATLLLGGLATAQAREQAPAKASAKASEQRQQQRREPRQEVDPLDHLPPNNPLAIYARTEAALKKAVREGSITERDAQMCLSALRILLAAQYERDVPEPGGRWF